MDLCDQIAALLEAHGLQQSDVVRLVKGLQFDLDQPAVRDAVGRKLSGRELQFVRTRLLRGDPLGSIVESMR